MVNGLSARRMALTLFLPFAFAYFMSYLFRSVNAVIADDLARAAGTEAAGLGLLTSAYFAAFAAFQIPLGILLDRFGPRRVEAALLTIAALGAVLFSLADTVAGMAGARALIGLGVCACLMGALKNATLWWRQDRLPLLTMLILATGGLGALAATTPVAALVDLVGWRWTMRGLGALTLAASAGIFLIVPEPQAEAHAVGSLKEQLGGVRRVFSSPLFWRLAPATVLLQATFQSYQGLWAAPWLRAVNGLDGVGVASYLQVIPLAMILGFAGNGLVTDRLQRLGIVPMTVVRISSALFLVVVLSLVLPGLGLLGLDLPAAQWAAFGFTATATMLTYSVLTQAFPPQLSGRVTTAINLLVFVAAFATQSAVGAMIEAATSAGAEPAGAHRLALAVMGGLTLAAFLWSLGGRGGVK
jgi:predicted MFS family arabinose efflux permease